MTAYLLADEGDNFLFPSPGFPLLLTIAKSMNITPRFYHLRPEQDWEANLEEMESLIDEKTKFIYVNDPSNPLGSCWSMEHKQDILGICKKHNLPLMADEIYEGVTYDKPVGTFADVSDGEVTIFKCSGLTKRWFGPGWRMGWLIVYGKENQIKNYLRGLKNICNIVLMPHTVLQASVKEIINNPENDADMKKKLEIMRKNQEMITNTLKELEYCQQTTASGALYGTIMLKL
jgi:tyrosine aminotransferase